MGANAMSHTRKKNIKFSPRQLRFLELYLSGFTLKDSAKAAGYKGASAQSLCNTGRAILRRAVANDTGIAKLLLDMAVNNQSESGRLKGLIILSKAMLTRR
jgi:hypothetical protein